MFDFFSVKIEIFAYYVFNDCNQKARQLFLGPI